MDFLNSVQQSIQRVVEGKIDFVAQKQLETLTYLILTAATVLSFLAGYLTADLRVSLGLFSFIVLVLLLAFVPPWPYLNRHPVTWRGAAAGSAGKSQ